MSVSSQTPASQQNHRSEVAMQGQNQNARLYGLTNGGAGMMQNSMRMGMQGYSSQPGMIRSQESDVTMKQGEGRLLSIEVSLYCTKLTGSELYSCRLGNRFPRTRSDILDFNCYGSRRLDFEFQRSRPRDSSSHSSSSCPHSDRRIDSTRCTRSNCCRSPLDR